jgi:hypothetical protein
MNTFRALFLAVKTYSSLIHGLIEIISRFGK